MTAAIIDRIIEADSFPQPAAVPPSLRAIRVGLAGCGVVGGSLVRLLDDCADTIASRHGVRIELSRFRQLCSPIAGLRLSTRMLTLSSKPSADEIQQARLRANRYAAEENS